MTSRTLPSLSDLLDLTLVLGTAGEDAIDRQGDGLLVLARGGDDRLVIFAPPDGSGSGSFVLAGAGNDDVTVYGDGNTILGGAGDDSVSLFSVAGTGAQDNTVLAGSGNDVILSVGYSAVLHGGSGDDRITITGQAANGNTAHGGAGNDLLEASGFTNNRLLGGAGEDTLQGSSRGIGPFVEGIGPGTVMTGGPGADRFVLDDFSHFRVLGGEDGILGEGDSLRGIISEVTDYEQGEVLDLGVTRRADGPVLALEAPVPPPGTFWPAVASGSYALLRGSVVEDGGVFAVEAEGPDTLVLYAGGQETEVPGASFAFGAVALRNWTVGEILIA
ncbi:hypothetical protein ACFQX4_13385 [Roseomonas sp. GCM10028921]